MGLHLPRPSGAGKTRGAAPSARRRIASAALLGVLALALSGCTMEDSYEYFALPDHATEESSHIANLWVWSWVAALVTGVVVWALLFWVLVRYRRRSADEVPVQTRYNLPLEIFYTIAPVMMVIVFFFHTVQAQNAVLPDDPDEPELTLEIVGQQWSWTFNYPSEWDGSSDIEEIAEGDYAYTVGSAGQIPTLVLPVDTTVRFNLHSPDVIHGFWIPGFLMKLDVVPGRTNSFQVTPTKTGTFAGKCTELCGVYHSRMLFNVEVVEIDEYEERVAEIAESGNVSADGPVRGGGDVTRVQGLLDEDNEIGGLE